jgi:hypothetical protein
MDDTRQNDARDPSVPETASPEAFRPQIESERYPLETESVEQGLEATTPAGVEGKMVAIEYKHSLATRWSNRPNSTSASCQMRPCGGICERSFPHRFRKSRDAACYVGLQPGRRNSGQSEPQMHISKEGDPYLRALLVQAAHHILGPWGVDSDRRRWGMKLAEHGGKRGKKRAMIAVARKLAVLLHRLWVSGDIYVPLRPSGRATLPEVA